MPKATVNNVYPLRGTALPQDHEAKLVTLSDSFLVHIQEFSPNLYTFMAKDYTHELLCKITLEVKEVLVSLEEESGGYLAPVVSCSLPSINLQNLNEKTGFDSYLQELLMGQFQLKILEQLLLFCEQNDAVHLILTLNDTVNGADLDYLKFYRRFLVSEEQVTTSRGEETQIVIPTDMDTYDNVIDFMDKIDREFRCALWRGQSVNTAFRDYLKSNACV
ncbi:MAG: hypothetical protein ACOH2E_04925 [Candidatus Paracaedibacter sp.]